MAFLFLFCLGALLVQQKWQGVDYEWGAGKDVYQGVIVDVPQEKAKTYLCKLRIDKKVSERGMAPVNRKISPMNRNMTGISKTILRTMRKNLKRMKNLRG